MRIETSKGKTHEIRVMCAMLRNPNRVLIEMEDGRSFAQIIKDFDGLETIKSYLPDGSRVYEMYEGFTSLVGIQRTESGAVRLTLERSEDA